MENSAYIALSRQGALRREMDVVANNIANMNTTAFKGENMMFVEHLVKSKDSESFIPQKLSYARDVAQYQNLEEGPLKQTGNSLDLAIHGQGYFVVDTPDGERYTRNGQFSVADDGRLLVGDGHEVLGTGGGSLTVQGGDISIDGEGSIFVNGQTVGQIQLVEFDDPQFLVREGATLYAATDQAKQTLRPAEQTTIVGGSLESANVQIPVEVSDMLLALRAYSANQKAITAIDETLNRLIDQVGAPN